MVIALLVAFHCSVPLTVRLGTVTNWSTVTVEPAVMVTFSPRGGTTPDAHVAGLLHKPPRAVDPEKARVVAEPVSGVIVK